MNKDRGFTLLELLAVIVILAVIVLITTPITMKVISSGKKDAAKDSMYSYIRAVNLAVMDNTNEETLDFSGIYTIKDGDIYSGTTKILNIQISGTPPENNFGNVTINEKGVLSARLKFNNYIVIYEDSTASIE